MESEKKIINNLDSSRIKALQQKSEEQTAILFKFFTFFYGYKWTSRFQECDREYAFKVWAEALIGMNDREFKRAIEACPTLYDFPPCPAEILHIAFDFYSENEAFNIAKSCSQKELESKLDASARNQVLLHARWVLKDIFNPYNAWSEEGQRRQWHSQYQDSIKTFLIKGRLWGGIK